MARSFFISYRRADAFPEAARIRHALEKKLGPHEVFLDVGSLAGGDFISEIDKRILACDAMLVVIGPDWNVPSLYEKRDFVRQEIERAIQLKKPIFPILVREAPSLREEELPESIRSLANYFQFHVAPDPSFDSAMGQLVNSLFKAYMPRPTVGELRTVAAISGGLSLFCLLRIIFSLQSGQISFDLIIGLLVGLLGMSVLATQPRRRVAA